MGRPVQIPPPRDIDEAALAAFEAWVIGRGRSEDTADMYRGNLRRCAAHPKGLTARLLSPALSPNTRRHNLAALSQWAVFSEDGELAKQLKSIRLPPARRVTPRVPLTVETWRALVKHLRTCDEDNHVPAMRPIHLIMAQRGIRVGDVVRIKRADLTSAKRTGVFSFEAKGAKRLEYDATPILPQVEALLAIRGDWTTVRELVGAGSHKACENRVRRALRGHTDELGIEKMYPHRLRRTYATAYLREMVGDPQATVKLQKHMQWSNIGTAMSYVDAVDQKELDAVGARVANLLGDDE